MHWLVPALVASLLLLAPPATQGADLVIWWEQTSDQEDGALRETIAAFERKSGTCLRNVYVISLETVRVCSRHSATKGVNRASLSPSWPAISIS